MKKKIITIVAVVLLIATLVGVLAACSSTKGVTFKKAEISVDYTAAKSFASSNVTEVSELAGYSYSTKNSNGLLVLFYKTVLGVTYRSLYNVETGTVLVSNSTDSFNLYGYYNNSFYTRSTVDLVNNRYTTTLYDSKGNEIKYLDDKGVEQSSFTSANAEGVDHEDYDIFAFAGNYFRVKKDGDTVERIGRIPELVSFDYDFFDYNDNYYYQISDRRLYIFDKSLNLKVTHFITGNLYDYTYHVMESGDVLVQTVTKLMDEDKKYSYIYDGKKYALKTYIVEAKDGDVKEKDFDYYISYFGAANAEDSKIKIDAENVAKLYPIEDGRLSKNDNDAMLVSITNKLKIKGRLDKMVDGQRPGTGMQLLKGYLIYNTALGNKLYTTDGTEIGYFPYNSYDDYGSNDAFFSKNGKFYDYSLKALFDYQAEGYSIVSWMNNSVILSKTIEYNTYYYRFDTSMTSPKQITTGTSYFSSVFDGYIYAFSTAGTYTYYNDKEEILSNLPSTAQVYSVATNSEKECGLFSAMVAGDYHYYRIG